MGNTRLPVEVQQHIEHTATQVLLDTGITPSQLREASADQLLALQTQLLMGNVWGRWEVAAELLPGRAVIESRRTYRLSSAVPEGLDLESESARQVWCELIRVGVAMRLWPGAKGVRTKYSTIRVTLETLGRNTRHIAAIDQPGFWSRATREQVMERIGHKVGVNTCNLLSRLKGMGVLADAPKGRPRPKKTDGPRDRTDEPEHTAAVQTARQFQPFSDAFTASAGWHAIQMIHLVGPTLLDALEAAASVALRTTRSLSYTKQVKAETLDPIIANWRWAAPDGTPLIELPMELHASVRCSGRFSWPPRTHAQAWGLLTVLQASHLWPVALASAGRHGELLSLEEDCLRRENSVAPTGAFHTWKLDGVAGREAEAPLPVLVVTALKQQKRLARLVKQGSGIPGTHLWVQTTTAPGQRLGDFCPALRAFTRAFALTPLLEGSSAHMHRFRKTLVRIVALTLVHAPKILMDILGHRDEQMTVLRYILSDPGILKEIEEVTRELIILKGVEAVTNADQLQGKAAPVLRERVASYAKRVGAKAMDPQNLMEFVRTMTEGGTGWAIIAPGIVCTGFKNGGLCNKGQGKPNPHYCNPACDNQLVMPTYDEDGVAVTSAVVKAIETMDYMLDKLREADEGGEDMLIAQFAGQVKSILGRWREVDQHCADHPMLSKHFPNVVLLT